jgi:hypothetical protein
MGMRWQYGVELIAKAYGKSREDKLWQMWLMRYPVMNKETFIPFSEFYKMHTQPAEEKKSTAQILEEAKQIREQIEAGAQK